MDTFKTERSSPPSKPRALAALAVAFLVIGSESFAEGRSLCLPKQTGTKHPARLWVHNASWASSKYTTQIARILLEERMGVDVEFVNFNGPTYQIYELVANGIIDADFETWGGGKRVSSLGRVLHHHARMCSLALSCDRTRSLARSLATMHALEALPYMVQMHGVNAYARVHVHTRAGLCRKVFECAHCDKAL